MHSACRERSIQKETGSCFSCDEETGMPAFKRLKNRALFITERNMAGGRRHGGFSCETDEKRKRVNTMSNVILYGQGNYSMMMHESKAKTWFCFAAGILAFSGLSFSGRSERYSHRTRCLPLSLRAVATVFDRVNMYRVNISELKRKKDLDIDYKVPLFVQIMFHRQLRERQG